MFMRYSWRAMKKSFMVFALSINVFTGIALAANEVRVWQDSLVLPTYKMNQDDVNPIFKRPLSYQGAYRVIYPYPVQDNFTGVKEQTTYQALYLENEFIKLCILPEIGGRLFYATDKTNDYEMFYRQHVIKPAYIGMLGAWISGGVEWCVFHHHRASTFMPVNYILVDNEDGSKTIWFGEYEPRQRMKWSIGITLFPGKSYLKADVRMFNRTDTVNSFLYWANVATHVNDDYQVFFPPSTEYGVYHAKNDFLHWPIARGEYRNVDYTGVDVSWWKNHPRPVSIFAHQIKEGFLAGYDHSKNAGTVHVCNPHIVTGAKLWEWGPSDQGQMWDSKVLTDSDGPYAELMTGAYSDNQPDYSWINPYEYKQAIQYWYPLREIGGVKSANLSAAVNLKVQEDGNVLLGFNATKVHKKANILLSANGKNIFQKTADIGPQQPFLEKIRLPKGLKEADLRASLGTGSGQELISYSPVKLDVTDKLPETVKPPKSPAEIETIEELYLTGLRIKQFHNARLNANDYFEEAAKRDPLDSRSNIQLGLDAAGRFLYEQAADRFEKAIKRISRDYTRPRDCEAYYQLGLVQKKQGKLDSAYDNLYRAAWDYKYRSSAYYQLAEIAAQKGNFREALDLINSSLEMNEVNTKALVIKSALLRRLEKYDAAMATAEKSLQIDPLDFLAINELKLSIESAGKIQQAKDRFRELERTMRDDPQSFIELAADYMNCGLEKESIGLLRTALENKNRASGYPIIHYYLAYLYRNDAAESKKFLESARKCLTDYGFPFRWETLDVLNYVIASAPDDSRAYYYLGNLLFDHQPENAIAAWQKAVQLEPSLAIAYRNLGWGYYYAKHDISHAIENYEKAIQYNPQDPRYYYELDVLYEKNGTNIKKRLSLLEGNPEVLAKHKIAFIRLIVALVQADRYDESIDLLMNNFFPVQEGSRAIHDTYVDARLLRGLGYYDQGQYEKALVDFLAADEYPENQQIGRDNEYARDIQIYYLTGQCYQAMKKGQSAQEYFQRAVSQQYIENGPDENQSHDFLYYKAIALRRIGQNEKTEEICKQLIREGNEKLSAAGEVDFFSKFGGDDEPHIRKAAACYLIALGHLGKGEQGQARQMLEKAVELDVNHIWARYYLKSLENKNTK